MPWQQINLITTAAEYPLINDFLENAGALAITLLDAADEPIFEPAPGEEILWQQIKLNALFEFDAPVENIMRELQQQLNDPPTFVYEISTLADQAWETLCQKDFHPLPFGDNCWICPSWHTIDDPNATVIHLDPGLAFGTGTHPTTQLCLAWLAQTDLTDKTVIDYGCGSGILAIAALKLGAKYVYAIDNDPQALDATAENLKKNALDPKAIFIGLPQQLPAINADILLANILANPLIALAKILGDHVTNHGSLVLSGILEPQINDVMAAYQQHFAFASPTIMQEWVRLVATKQ